MAFNGYAFYAVIGYAFLGSLVGPTSAYSQSSSMSAIQYSTALFEKDPMRDLQQDAIRLGKASFGHWGTTSQRYADWSQHSNRLIPIYTFGIDLDWLRNQGSVYQRADTLKPLYGQVPKGTVNPDAKYFDQTDVYRLQLHALASGKRNIILLVFDGMDWDTTRAAALYRNGRDAYAMGRGSGLLFQDYDRSKTDFGYFVSSSRFGKLRTDVDAQLVFGGDRPTTGGYSAKLGGAAPWDRPTERDYLIGQSRSVSHTVTDSASSATSMTSGIKTYNGSVNVAVDGSQSEPIARKLQRQNSKGIGIVTSVPISHATPAAAYANNVSRADYQDISRDLLGLRSVAHRGVPLPGVDVLLGAGWRTDRETSKKQGANFVPGNRYLTDADLKRVSIENGGKYVVVQRTKGKLGDTLLEEATAQALRKEARLLGFFGADNGHLPFQTANGSYNPTQDSWGGETYMLADLRENPTLAQMTAAALEVLQTHDNGFWLMVESGDVDWANHANNIDNSIGAVFSGEAAFSVITDWVEQHSNWDETAVIVTADHGHYLVIENPDELAATNAPNLTEPASVSLVP